MDNFDHSALCESEHIKHPSRSTRNHRSTLVSLSLTPESAQSFTLSVADFRRSGAFCDLEIACKSAETVKCHRIVAASASPVLRSALKAVEDDISGDDGIASINLPDFSFSAVEAYVNAVYDALSGVSSALQFRNTGPEVQELARFLTKEVTSERDTKVPSLVSTSTAARCQSCRTSLNPYPESTANLTVIDLKDNVSPPAPKVPKLEESGDDVLLPAKRDRRREQKLKLHRGEKVPVEEMRRMVENCSGSFFPVRTNKNAFEPGKKKDRYCMKNENDFLVLCGVARCSKKKVLLAREEIQQHKNNLGFF